MKLFFASSSLFPPILSVVTLTSTIFAEDVYYPDWTTGSGNCIKDDINDVPLDIYNGNYYKATADACCLQYYSYDECDCRKNTEDGTECTGSGEWYVDYQNKRCVQDCPEDSTIFDRCGGLAGSGADLFGPGNWEGAVECCAEELEYLALWLCTANSFWYDYVGSGGFYGSSQEQICVMDCDPNAPDDVPPEWLPLCGGIITNSYTTVHTWIQEPNAIPMAEGIANCCAAEFPSADPDVCACLTDRRDPDEGGCLGTDKLHADPKNFRCVYDYDTEICENDYDVDNCIRADMSTNMYGDGTIGEGSYPGIKACCAAEFPWIPSDFCFRRTLSLDTELWYADLTSMSCKQDCVYNSVTRPQCELLERPPNAVYDTVEECCADGFSSIDSDVCEAKSLSGEDNYDGAGKWYAGLDSKCGRDCPTNEDPVCIGVAPVTTEKFFEEVTDCCDEKFEWQDLDLCASRSSNSYTNKFYKTYSNGGECLMHCEATEGPCAGHPEDLSVELYDDAETCCQSMTWLVSDSCAATASGEDYDGTGMWYENTSDGEFKCVRDCSSDGEDPTCGGIVLQKADLFETPILCCTAKHTWIDAELCQAISTGAYTGKFYLQQNECVQHCPAGAGISCAGNPQDLSVDLWDDASECCQNELAHLPESVCISQANAVPLTGTGLWYENTSDGKSYCVQDCDDSNNFVCGGIMVGTDTLYNTPLECCQQNFDWYDEDLCTAMTLGTHTGKWYHATENGQICVKDCDGADPECQGHPTVLPVDLHDDSEDCCESMTWVLTEACVAMTAGEDYEGTGMWYENTSDGEFKCVRDCSPNGDPTCGGVVLQKADLYDTPALCCADKHNWIDGELCEALSVQVYTGKFYMQQNKCVQHCPEGGAAACAGDPQDLSVDLWADASECCENELGHLPESVCLAETNGTPLIGTGLWYENTSDGKSHCVQDCNDANNANCGGIMVGTDTLYDSPSECCQFKFSWYDEDLCAAISTGTHTDKWYHAGQICVKDCDDANDECEGYPADLSVDLYDDAEDCCDNKVSSAAEACLYQSTGTTPTGTPEWWVDWSRTTCVANCEKGSAPNCGGFHKWGDDKFNTQLDCCKRIYWVSDSVCDEGKVATA